MSDPLTLAFRRRPRTWGSLARAVRPSPGLARVPRIPSLAAHWTTHWAGHAAGHAAGYWRLEAFHALTGLPRGANLPLLYLHVLSFPLQFALLTHPAFPVPIWGLMQVRNHLLLHRPVRPTDRIEQTTRIVGQRTLARATEVDLHSVITRDGERVYEGLNTYWMRPRVGAADPPSPRAAAPTPAESTLAAWRAPVRGGLRFARVSGDYNGVHWANFYARRLGFPQAFLHPQRVLAMCMGHLPAVDPTAPHRLDGWIKGQMACGAALTLYGGAEGAEGAEGAQVLGLRVADDPRPALVLRVRPPQPGERLG